MKVIVMRKNIPAIALSVFILAGCASDPDEISGTYVSPMQYQNYNCNQIRQEAGRLTRRVQEVTGQQQEEATGDKVATGVGIVLFWPALFFLADDDKEEELKRLKGEYEAVQKAAIQKECSVAEEIREAKEKAQKKREEQKQKYEEEKKGFNE